MARKYFSEKQSTKDPILLSILVLLDAYMIYLFVDAALINFSQHSVALILLGSSIIFISSVIWLFLHLRIKLSVSEKGISYKMSPLHQKKHRIKWDDVEGCKVIETPRLAHMHTGNMKFWSEKKYTFTGRNGLAIRTKDGSRYFIGSHQTDELKDSVKRALRKRA